MRNYSDLEEQLKAVVDSSSFEEIGGGEQHRLRTAACPSLADIVKGRLTVEQYMHTQSCLYCEKILGLATPTWSRRVRGLVTRAAAFDRVSNLSSKLAYCALIAILVVQVGQLVALRKTAADSAESLAALRETVPPALRDIDRTLKDKDANLQVTPSVDIGHEKSLEAFSRKSYSNGGRRTHRPAEDRGSVTDSEKKGEGLNGSPAELQAARDADQTNHYFASCGDAKNCGLLSITPLHRRVLDGLSASHQIAYDDRKRIWLVAFSRGPQDANTVSMIVLNTEEPYGTPGVTQGSGPVEMLITYDPAIPRPIETPFALGPGHERDGQLRTETMRSLFRPSEAYGSAARAEDDLSRLKSRIRDLTIEIRPTNFEK